ncbi:MAG: hypothetical protein H6730_38310, partial [Deltaproteobacteria bacterium]|nr:hypothetical protein [Deltaproteobacteria bacterium]
MRRRTGSPHASRTLRRLVAVGLTFTAGACSDTTSLTAVHPQLGELPPELDFGVVYLGVERALEVVLRNEGSGPLQIVEVAGVEAPFSIREAPTTIAGGNTGVVVVVFRPSEVGPARGELRLLTDEGVPARTVALLGQALAAPDCDDHEGCTIDRFDPERGACVHEPRDGACDDGSACTEQDRCTAGVCLGRAVRCDDGVACTDDLCDPARGCVAVPVDARCADDDPCSIDRCGTGGCENPPAPDGYPCGDVVSCVSAEICLLHQCVEVSIPEGAPCDDGDRCTTGDRCTAATCVGEPAPRPPTVVAESTLVYRPTSGTLRGSRLYVATSISDRLRFKVVALDATHAAPTHPWPEADGSAHLVEVAPDRLARVSTSSVGTRWLEVFDATDPDHLRRVHRLAVGYFGRTDETLTGQDGRVYFCAASAPGGRPALQEVDLLAAGGPGAPVPLSDYACQDRQSGFVATADVWVSWDNDPVGHSAGWLIFRLSPGAATLIHSHGFNTQGVHRYGGIEQVATDGHVVVVDLENDRYLRVVDLDLARPTAFDTVVSNLPQARLLGVHARRALYRLRDAVVEVDLTDPANPVRLPDQLDLGANRRPELVALDATYAVLWDTLDGLIVLRRAPSGLRAGPTFRGDGTIASLRGGPSGLLLASSVSFGFVTPADLLAPNLANATDTTLLALGSPAVLTGPDGAAGLSAPLVIREVEPCSPFNWGCSRTQPTPLPGVAIARLPQVRLAADGTLTSTAGFIQMSNDLGAMAAAEGCLGAGFDDYFSAERYVALDLCVVPGEATVVGELPTTVPPGFGVAWARTVIHGPGYASFVGKAFA